MTRLSSLIHAISEAISVAHRLLLVAGCFGVNPAFETKKPVNGKVRPFQFRVTEH
jgi:hypothetical protein